MSIDPTRNFAKVRVSTTYDSSATSIVLMSGDGAKLPDPLVDGSFNLTWFNNTNYPDPSDDPSIEIVRVISRSGDTLTVVRGQENTTASNKNTASVTYLMILALTKKMIDDMQKFSIATDQTDFVSQSFQNILKNGNFESWSSGITYAPDGWSAGAGTTMLADSSNKKMGTYGASITSPNGSQGYIYQSIPDLTYFKGRTITIGGWAKTSTSSRVCIYIQDGISYSLSPYHTGSGNWEYLVLPFGVSSSATELTVFCIVYVAGTPVTAYFDGIILVEGSVVGAFSPRPLYDDGKTLTIDSINNRVGIGTVTPSAKLAINGGLNVGSDSDPGDNNLNVDGNITVGGTIDGVDISLHNISSTGVHGIGTDTIDGVSARNSAISTHTAITSSVHNFDASGNAPAQIHGSSRHTGIIGDHTTNLSNVGSNTHAQIDTAITASTGHIAASTGIHNVTGSVVGTSDTQTLSNKTLDNTNIITIKDSNLTIQDDLTTTKQAKFQASGITAATTRTITLQDADITMESTAGSTSKVSTHAAITSGVHGITGSVVGTSDTQTLSNKTLDNTNIITIKDSNLTIQDDLTTTKQAKFQASGITAATTRTITLQDADITMESTAGSTSKVSAHAAITSGVHGVTGNIVGTSDTQTLSGKTLTTPTIGDFTNANHTHSAAGATGGVLDHVNLSNKGTNTHAQIDTAIGTTLPGLVTTHAGLITGVHGVTGSYILGTEDIGVANGVAGLDSGGKVPTSQLPALALTNVYTVANQAAQLALNATTQEGDVAIRTDENKSYARNAGVAGTMADWSLLLTPTDAVLSVFGRTGAVSATTNDYTWAQINKTTSNLSDITTKSHTVLSDIGVNTHAQLDTGITNSINHIAATGTAVHGLGTMSTQNAATVAITGGTITGITGFSVASGIPTVPTAAVTTDTTQIATTAFVNAEIANDAPTKTGGGASGTWGISITGNAATSTNATSHIAATGTAVHGLGTMSTQNAATVAITGGTIAGITDIAITDGGTGASDTATARTNLGLVAGGAGDIWLEKAGDTMTGNLTFSNSQKIIGGTSTTADLTLQTTTGIGTTGADMHFLVGNNGATEAMTILNSGYVGIGEVNPLRRLEVVESTVGQAILANFRNNDTSATSFAEINITSGSTSPQALRLGVTDDTYSGWTGGAFVYVTGTNGRLALGANNTEIVSILPSGNVGIGTTVPSQKLTVVGDTTIGDGGTTNYRKIDTTGAMTMEGTAQPLAELQYMMGTEGFGVRTPLTNSASMNTTGDANGEIGVCQFADNATNYLDISFKIPGNYEQNTNVYIELIWKSSATSGNCYWGVAYSAVAADEAINPALSTFTTGQFLTSGTANARNNHMITLISPTIDPEDFVTLRIERLGADALDTINTTADLIAANIQFGVNS